MKKSHPLVIISFLLLTCSRLFAQENEKVPYVPSPIEVVDRMLEFADVGKGDVVFDVGSGDGRMVIQAAKNMAPRAWASNWIPSWWNWPAPRPNVKASILSSSSDKGMPSRPIYRPPRW